MALRTSRRLGLEPLEDRTTPAYAVSVVNGTLLVSGAATTPGDQLLIVRDTGDGKWDVFEGAAKLASDLVVTRDISVQMTSASDDILIDMGTLTTTGGVNVYAGNGNNTVAIVNGSVSGVTTVNAGTGGDTILLGDAASAMFKTVTVNAGSGYDQFIGAGTITASGLNVNLAELVTLDPGATVIGGMNVTVGSAYNSVLLAGNNVGSLAVSVSGVSNMAYVDVNFTGLITNDLIVQGGTYNTLGQITLTVDAGSTLGRNLTFVGSGGNDLVDVQGTVGRTVSIKTGNGFDIVNLLGSVNLTGSGTTRSLYVDTGSSADYVTVAGDTKGAAAFYLGAGDDTLDIFSNINLGGSAAINGLCFDAGTGIDSVAVRNTVTGGVIGMLGGGDDFFLLDATASVTFTGTTPGFYLDGGADADDVLLLGAVSGPSTVLLGAGDDTFSAFGTFTTGIANTYALYLDGGAGADIALLYTTAYYTGPGTGVGKVGVYMGADDDYLDASGLVLAGIAVTDAKTNGGLGTDTIETGTADPNTVITLEPVGTDGSYEVFLNGGVPSGFSAPAAPATFVPPLPPLPPGITNPSAGTYTGVVTPAP